MPNSALHVIRQGDCILMDICLCKSCYVIVCQCVLGHIEVWFIISKAYQTVYYFKLCVCVCVCARARVRMYVCVKCVNI